MKTTKLIATVLVAGMLVTGCGLTGGKAIIKINGHAITQGQFDKAIDKQIAASPFAKMGGDLKNNKEGMLYLMTEKAVLDSLIIKTIFDEELKNRGIKVSDKEINEAIDRIIDKLGSKEQLNNLLKQNGVSVKDFKSDIENQVKLKKLANKTVKSTVTDKEVKDYYEKNKALFTHKEQVRAYHILIANNRFQLEQEIAEQAKKDLSPDELQKRVAQKIEENKALANKIAKELKDDNSKFEAYAKKYSRDFVSAQRGGDLGYFEAGNMVPSFSKAAFSAKPNTIVGPVESDYGLHIIMVTDRKAAGTEPFDKVKTDIKDRLKTQKELKALDDILKAAKKKAKIEYISDDYNPDVIEKKLEKQLKGLKEAVTKQGKKN